VLRPPSRGFPRAEKGVHMGSLILCARMSLHALSLHFPIPHSYLKKQAVVPSSLLVGQTSW
jgi:hypothetical protein